MAYETNPVWLSTIDNPFDYFNEFENWLNFDLRKGYNCCALIDRLAYTSETMSDFDYYREIERVVDLVLDNDVEGHFIKVRKHKGGGSS